MVYKSTYHTYCNCKNNNGGWVRPVLFSLLSTLIVCLELNTSIYYVQAALTHSIYDNLLASTILYNIISRRQGRSIASVRQLPLPPVILEALLYGIYFIGV